MSFVAESAVNTPIASQTSGPKPACIAKYSIAQPHGDVDRGHPATVMPPVVDRRRPEELERPREAEQRQHADLAQLDALLAEVDRKDLVEDAERKAFGEVQDADPEQLVRRSGGGGRRGVATVFITGAFTVRVSHHPWWPESHIVHRWDRGTARKRASRIGRTLAPA